MRDSDREGTRESVRQWLTKANSDWDAVEILQNSPRCPTDVVCFHCQQYVEKLLKSLLTLHGVEAPKTHDLRRLTQLAVPFLPEIATLSDAADALTIHGVQTRYPDDYREIDSKEMEEMVTAARAFGEILLANIDV